MIIRLANEDCSEFRLIQLTKKLGVNTPRYIEIETLIVISENIPINIALEKSVESFRCGLKVSHGIV